MKPILPILALCLSLAGCSEHHDPIDVPRSKARTTGWMEGDGWHETERRAVGDAVYTKYENATEIRWFELKNLRSRPMGAGEQVPK